MAIIFIPHQNSQPMMRMAGKMKLLPGYEEEYQRRHGAIWPELKALLKSHGIREYSIFLDEQTLDLFACFQIEDPQALETLPAQEIMKRWWHYMKDIMETNPDESPEMLPLKEVFYLQ